MTNAYMVKHFGIWTFVRCISFKLSNRIFLNFEYNSFNTPNCMYAGIKIQLYSATLGLPIGGFSRIFQRI